MCDKDLNSPIGILHVKRAISLILKNEFSKENILEIYNQSFHSLGAKLFTELKSFQNRAESISVIVDEYGEIQGIVTPQDIIEELVGEFKTTDPTSMNQKFCGTILEKL